MKAVAITGEFEESRADIVKRLNALGFGICFHVTRKTDFLLIGKFPGSKLVKAERLGIPILKDLETVEANALKGYPLQDGAEIAKEAGA